MHILPSVTLLVSAALLGGCGNLLTCQGPSDIGDGGRSIPPLRVPAGLAEINTREALRVPELNEPERPRDDSKCLDQPPGYFPDRRVGAEAPAESRPPAPQAPGGSSVDSAPPPMPEPQERPEDDVERPRS
ncbi:MAG: hypothetical protein HC872_04120 [Gammaproteobacteria bacterium]|nr:hypothetical protein [Gammaproteobacteria bacterium]